jgi:endo-1,4-beta-xylanase
MAGPSLAELAAARGKVFGTAYRSTFAVDDPCYREVAVSEFGSLTTEIGTMMNTVQPAAGVFDFHESDAVAELAEQTRSAPLGHHAVGFHRSWITDYRSS